MHTPSSAMREMARVLRCGGWLIASCGNSSALTRFVEPLDNPLLGPAKQMTKQLLHWLRLRKSAGKKARARTHRREEFDRLVSCVGLKKIDSRTVGFGPLRMLGHRLLPNALGLKLNSYLQELSDRAAPGVRSIGTGYIVLAQKVAMPDIRSDE